MFTFPLIVVVLLLVAALFGLALGWKVRRHLLQDIVELRRHLSDVQSELHQEQGKATRLAGFLARIQHVGSSSAGQIQRREFAEALIDSTSSLLKVDEVVLFLPEALSLDLLPAAARGVSPENLARARVRIGESVLGLAAQSMKTVVQNSAVSQGELFFFAPYLIIPLRSRERCAGLLLLARPQGGPFSAEACELAQLFATQAALILQDLAQQEDVELLGEQTVSALTRTLAAKDFYTHEHSVRTGALVRAFTQELGLPEMLIREIEYGACLHDIGKLGIEQAILLKPGPLTPQEYDVIKTHPGIGYHILQPISFLKQASPIVLYHQEWYNGAGYPDGLAGEEIPLGARIVQIIDAWDAMTSDRPYRKAMPRAAAGAELRRQEGTQFDPKLVEVFLRVIERLEREGIPTTEPNVGPTVLAARP